MNSLLKQQPAGNRASLLENADLNRYAGGVASVNYGSSQKKQTLDPTEHLYHKRNDNSDQVSSAMMQYYVPKTLAQDAVG